MSTDLESQPLHQDYIVVLQKQSNLNMLQSQHKLFEKRKRKFEQEFTNFKIRSSLLKEVHRFSKEMFTKIKKNAREFVEYLHI